MPETDPESEPHPIRLRNTLTRRVERLVPLDWREGSVPEAHRRVRMYVCGPTVYDRAHLGNARAAVVYDVLFRLLRHVYGEDRVTYVRNLTDIDDKIIARAQETGRSVESITEETIRWYHEDMDALGCLRPTDMSLSNGRGMQMYEPRATEYLPQMIAMIEALIARGHAYEAEGHVLFSVASYEAYGRLSGRSVEDMIAGARVTWPPTSATPWTSCSGSPRARASPAGRPLGPRPPGWHIECSAMARDLLGGAFDIHGGGLDLQFPHHENELAQSRCAHPDEGFAQVWMHNEMLMVDGRKMSKSLGNFTTVRDLLDRGVPGEVIRLALLGTHYSKPLDWTDRRLKDAESLREQSKVRSEHATGQADVPGDFLSALSDDLNTALASSLLHRLGTGAPESELVAALKLIGIDPFMSQIDETIVDWIAGGSDTGLRIVRLLNRRDEARAARDFARADAIRDALGTAGVVVKDTPKGAEWEAGPTFDPAKLEAIA